MVAVIYFLTGNKHKVEEAQKICPFLEQYEVDLPEVQGVNSREIVEEKLREGMKVGKFPFIVEDTSLVFDCIKPLPGPLVKWFLKSIGVNGMFDLVSHYDNPKAEAICMVGYAESPEKTIIFEGRVPGTIVSPIVKREFGWDPIFMPDGEEKRYSEMDIEYKNTLSHRTRALQALNEHLNKN